MSTQFGGGTGRGSNGNGGEPRDNEGCKADELRGLIESIAAQFNAAEQRQTATLSRMLSKVEALGAEARSYKDKVPDHFLPAFERIEDGVTMLADRIAAAREVTGIFDEPAAEPQPAPAADPFGSEAEFDADKLPAVAPKAAAMQPAAPKAAIAEPAFIDPVMANDDESWDTDAAEALAAHYERELGGPAGPASDPEQRPARDPAPAPAARLLDTEREWLEARFVDIARRVEESVTRSAPVSPLADLDTRFQQLEHRFGSALTDVATRSDVEGLRLVEAQIMELAQRFDEARDQLGRLEGIEHTLAAVVERLSDPRFDDVLERGAGNDQDLEPMISAAVEQIAARFKDEHAAPTPDFAGLATAAAEQVAHRFADMGAGHGDLAGEEVYAVRQLLEQFINERREGEEQTAAMLDTMQQAMLRVLDRVDALEVSHSKAAPQEYVREQVRFAADANAGAQRAAEAATAFAAKARSNDMPPHRGPAGLAEGETAERPFVVPQATVPRPASELSDTHQRLPSSPATIERLRQDFVADAQRAKLKAQSSQTDADVEPVMRGPAPTGRVRITEPELAAVPIGKSGAHKAPEADAGGSFLTSSLRRPSRKLIVSAIVLMIAIPGVLMLLKKRAPSAPATPVAVEKSQPRPETAADRGIVPIKPAATSEGSMAPTATPPSMPMGDERTNQVPAHQPEEPAAQSDATKSGASVEDPKQDLYRTSPKTQSRGIGEEIQVPEEIREDRNSSLPSRPVATTAPPAGITIAQPSRAPSLAQLAKLEERQTMAQLSSQLGAAQVDAVPAALIPEFMREGAAAGTVVSPIAPSPQQATLSEARRQPLDLPPASVGPLSLRLAAAKGDPSAEFEVGARYAEGKGLDQSFPDAMRWYQKSATRGFAQAQYRLATFYERGLAVKADTARAKVWYQRAAEQGNVKAMHNLAVLSAGRTAKTPDYAAAARWFRSAADHGLADSQFNLAVLYESGLGVEKNEAEAYKWFALAARQGDPEGQRRQQELERSMRPADLDQAQRQLATWRPKQADRVANDPIAAGEAWKARATAEGQI